MIHFPPALKELDRENENKCADSIDLIITKMLQSHHIGAERLFLGLQ